MKKNGFTLFEVMIAMAIMSSAAVLLATAWGGNQLRVRKMAINNQAAFLLERMMSEIEMTYKQQVDRIPEKEAGDFGSDYPDFRWEMSSQDFEMPDMRSLFINEGEGSEMMLLMIDKLSEFFNESVKEVTVTVIYSKGKGKKKRSVKYSAQTFIVDFDKPLPLGLPGGGVPGGN